MPVRYVIHKDQRLVLTIGSGRVTLEEITAHRSRLLRDPQFHPTFHQLNDFTATTSTDLTGAKISWFAAHSVFSPTSRRAFVVDRPAIFGMARQFATYHGDRSNVHVFYRWHEALKWLGIRDISSPLLY